MRKFNKKILLASPTMHGDEMRFVQKAFDTGWVVPLGFNCDAFEQDMNDYLHRNYDGKCYSLCLSSGTSALHLACKLAGVKRGDIVLCSDMTFSATVNPVSYECGCQVFIDAEYDTWNMDPEALELAFKKYPQAKVVFLVHLYGVPAKIDEIIHVCHKHNALLVEDAAEALSSTYKLRPCGTFGNYGIFSFNGNKIITSSGGGMLITHFEEERKKALFWATQSRENEPWYQHKEIGYNYRMSNVVAGIGRGQLEYLDEHKRLKKQIYYRYREALKDLPVMMNPFLGDTEPNFWLSCITINKDCNVKFMTILNKLKEYNIESRPIWKPMHLQPVFAGHDFLSVSSSPVGEDIFSRGLCLPSDIKMTEEEQQYVIEIIKSCF